jgi:CRISPR-associated protein Csm5
LTKKEYIFIPAGNRIVIPDYAKFARFLDGHNLINEYTAFMTGSQSDLFLWLGSKGVKTDQFDEFAAYEVNAGDAIVVGKPFRGVQIFIKDNYGKPYIPGSSLKGALRTAILAKLASDNPSKSRAHFEKMCAGLDRIQYFKKSDLKHETEQMEADFLHTLDYKKQNGQPSVKTDAINSALKGLQVSDSLPLETDTLTLCAKRDVKKNGDENALPICRECLKPGVLIHFDLTIDSRILATAGIDIGFIKSAVAEFSAMQSKYFSSKFKQPPNAEESLTKDQMELILGGGAGFVSKTLVYPLGKEKGLDFTGRLMVKQFRNHKHEFDEKNGVSPHIIKYTSYQGRMYLFGRCELTIQGRS